MTLPFFDADSVLDRCSFARAVDVLESALLGGLDPTSAHDRSAVGLAHGQLLMMPAETATATGVKLVSVAPGNAERGLPRVQAVYVLLDRATLTPTALLDGTALTTLRTPAVSAVAVRHLADPAASRLVVIGSGPQAWGHVEAIRSVRPLESVVVVGRHRGRAQALAQRVAASGLAAEAGTVDDIRTADIVACATTAAEPLFGADLLDPHTCVVAVGAHEPDKRELPAELLGQASVVAVESVSVAMAGAGDIVMAVSEGALDPDRLIDLGQVVRSHPTDGVSVFKSVGMGWQDLVVAEAVVGAVGG